MKLQPISCVECRRRKIKCNRLFPCEECTLRDVSCSYPKVIRKRRQTKDVVSELADRLNDVEQKLTTMSSADTEIGVKDTFVQLPVKQLVSKRIFGPSSGLAILKMVQKVTEIENQPLSQFHIAPLEAPDGTLVSQVLSDANLVDHLISGFFGTNTHNYYISEHEVRSLAARFSLDGNFVSENTDSVLLLLIIIATGARCITNDSTRGKVLDDIGSQMFSYYDILRRSSTFETVATVQAYLLEIESWVFVRNIERAWTAVFNCVRSAYMLGLNLKDGKESLSEQQQKASIWIAVERMESLSCLATGRFNIIQQNAVQIDPPTEWLRLKMTSTDLIRQMNVALLSLPSEVPYREVLVLDGLVDDHRLEIRKSGVSIDTDSALLCELADLYTAHSKLHLRYSDNHAVSERKVINSCRQALEVAEKLTQLFLPSLEYQLPTLKCFFPQIMTVLYHLSITGRRPHILPLVDLVTSVIDLGSNWDTPTIVLYQSLISGRTTDFTLCA